MKNLFNSLKNHKELILIIFILSIAAIAFSYNLFHYPYYENDEGTYMSRAWSVVTQFKLSPYTYGYDHAPVGWFLIAIWEAITGFFTFGFSINSGRVLMLVLHVVSVYFLYLIAKKISGSKTAASISVLIFALSPLGLSFERRVLLDNIMTFWLLFSYYLILGVGQGKRLSQYILSAILFGISVLSKESGIFFLPVMLFTVYKNAHISHRLFALWMWLVASLSVVSLYFLYALVQGEFFPTGTFLGGAVQHVSIISTFQHQLLRAGGFFLNPSSDFITNLKDWFYGGYYIPLPDPIILVGGVVSSIALLLLSVRNKRLLFVVLPTIAYSLFLIRGGVIFSFYIIPAIPFLALSIGVFINILSEFLSFNALKPLVKSLIVIVFTIPFIWYYTTHLDIYTLDQTTVQLNTLEWISKNVPKSAHVAIDNYAYVDFHDSKSKYSLPKSADYYWNMNNDPEVRNKVLKNNWKNINYIIETPQVKYDVVHSNLSFVKKAFDNSVVLKKFSGPNKWYVSVRKVVGEQYKILFDEWTLYKSTFVASSGQTTDTSSGKTTSEGQSYALLHAISFNDKQTFDKVLKWTVKNTQLSDKNLFAWWYGKNDKGKIGIIDKGTATDADQDIATALILANKKWHDTYYLNLAKKIITDIWNYETAEINGTRYVVAGDWTSNPHQDVYTINPSYLSPYAYKMFAEIDKKHNWLSVANSSYEILDKCSASSLGVKNSVFLPPNWCNITKDGKIEAATNIGQDSSDFSFDALRVIWRIGLDYQLYKDPRAMEYLKKISLFTNEWNKQQKIYSSYLHDGKNIDKSESLLQYSAMLSYFKVVNPQIANLIYQEKFKPQLKSYKSLIYWGDKNNYYTQNWIMFGVGLYDTSVFSLN